MNREKMEKRLRESDERYRLLLDRAPEAIWFNVYEEPIDITLPEMEIARLINETGIIVEANDAMAKMQGFDTGSQLIGKHWGEFIPFEENEEYYLKFVRSNYNIRGDTSVEADREGNIYHVENSLVGNIVDGKLVSSFGVGRDITRRVQAEEKLGRSAERVEHLNLVLRAIRNVNQLIVREKDRDKLLKGVCDNFVESRGYFNAWIVLLDESGKIVAHTESGLGKDFLPMVESLKRGQLTVCGQRALKQTEAVITEDPSSTCADCPLSSSYAGRSAAIARLEYDGKVYGLLSVSVPIEMTTDVEELDLFHEVATDIAFALHNIELEEQRKQAEEELRKTRDYLDSLLRYANAPIIVWDTEQRITMFNTAFERLTGYMAGEVIRQPLSMLFTEASRDESQAKIRQTLGGEYWESVEIPILRKDGEIRIVLWNSANVYDKDGKTFQATIAQGNDITEHKQAEEKLRESNERYQFLMDRALEAIWFTAYEEPIDITLPEMEIARLISGTGIIVEANDVLAKMHGFDTGSQLIGKHWSELDSAEYDLQAAMKMVRCHYRVDRCTFEGKDLEENTAYFEESEVGNIVDGKLVSSFGLARDITGHKKMEKEKKELEQKAQLASRLATVGEVASGVAHEINNPLTGVIGFSQLLSQREDIPEDIKQHLEIITEGSQRVASIVSRLLAFARQHKLERSYVDINKLLENTLELRAYEMQTSNIKLSTRLDSALPRTMADGAQLQQVFLNIIMNAETEMKEAHGKGKLLVKTEAIDDTIRISFKDDGPGISPENLGRLFEPFFTTREVGKGTGLGLSVCHGIIAEHNGRIYAKSKLGHGATFIVELPVFLEEKQLELDGSPADESRKVTGAKILVVDDEPITLQLLAHLLSGEGYDVESTGDAETALAKIKSERYNLILLDIKLPGMSGIELYKNMQKTARSLASRVVFITGDAMAPDTMSFLSRTKAPYISKPFDIKKLKQTIKRILAQS